MQVHPAQPPLFSLFLPLSFRYPPLPQNGIQNLRFGALGWKTKSANKPVPSNREEHRTELLGW